MVTAPNYLKFNKKTFTSPEYKWLQQQTDPASKLLFEQLETAWNTYADLKNDLIYKFISYQCEESKNNPTPSKCALDVPWN